MSLPKLDRALWSRRMAAVVVVWMIPAGVTARAQQNATRDLPTVAVFSTGGTISGRGASPTSLTEYKAGALLGEELVAAVPEIKQYANVKVEQVINVGSPNITLANWLTLANRVNAAFATDPKLAGVVITHGTNTLEETAYFLNLTVRDARPVVLVGSQRPATAISSDGPLNLLNAIRTAASPDARGKGVLVVMNEEISAARDVTKTNTYRVETFKAPDSGFSGTLMPTRSASIARRRSVTRATLSSTSVGSAICRPSTSSIRMSTRVLPCCPRSSRRE
jgi:L-asparaginase type II